MTTAKIQLRGNCQCCGRDQAVVKGRMAKHGYEVKDRGDFGYFTGVCSGNNYEPLQVKRDIADSIVRSCRKEALDHDRRAEDLRTGKTTPLTVQGHYSAQLRDYERLPFADAPGYKQREAIESAIYQQEQRARLARSFAERLEKLADLYHGQPLTEVPADAGPAPILNGEKRKGARGVLTATSVFRGMVRWVDENGYRGSTSTRAWRLFEQP
jgi:hypothetical protein